MFDLFTWAQNTQMCSANSQALLYAMIASSLSIAAAGFYVWRRYIRTQPGASFQMQTESGGVPGFASSKALAVLSGAGLMMVTGAARAQSGGGEELGGAICQLVEILTGKWLFGFTILATLGSGAALLFGGEITDGLKKIATIISIVGIILATSSILSKVFTWAGGGGC